MGPFYDEAFEPDGTPRPEYGELLAAIDEAGPARLASALDAAVARTGASFGSGTEPFPTDPVPRLISEQEWVWLERALEQRSRALNAFIADVYGERRICAAGVVPLDAVTSADHYEPAMTGVAAPIGHAPVIGYDLVRGSDGRLRVLEDNLRTPSGLAYAAVVQRALESVLPVSAPRAFNGAEACFDSLARVAATALERSGGTNAVILSDGPSNSAWYEHFTVGRRLGISMVTPDKLRLSEGRLCAHLPSGRLRPIDVLYRRTDEDNLRDEHGRPTWLADMLLEPLRRGTLIVVNAPGSGIGDDKLIHAYVEEMIRFYLGEEPLIESVKTYDLSRADSLTRALGTLGRLVVKPRSGHGGHGVVICAQIDRSERERVGAVLRAQPQNFVAQETVLLSLHPTVVGDALEPRHVDLRVFACGVGDDFAISPCALTRVALEPGSLIVNSSQGGGAKDTWITSTAG